MGSTNVILRALLPEKKCEDRLVNQLEAFQQRVAIVWRVTEDASSCTSVAQYRAISSSNWKKNENYKEGEVLQ
jgi:hypothetical protein